MWKSVKEFCNAEYIYYINHSIKNEVESQIALEYLSKLSE